MRVLTGYPLWFGLIAAGLKPDENRDRNIIRRENFGVPFALHHGAAQPPKKHAETWGRIAQISPDLVGGWCLDDETSWPPWYRLSRITKAVVAVVTIERRALIAQNWLFDADTLERICPVGERRFAFGPVIYMLRDVQRLPSPVPCLGRQGFWTLPEDVEQAVNAQLVRTS